MAGSWLVENSIECVPILYFSVPLDSLQAKQACSRTMTVNNSQ